MSVRFIEIRIENNMLSKAKRRNELNIDRYGAVDENTVLASQTSDIRKSGYLAEEITLKAFPFLMQADSPNYDLVFQGKKIEVKAGSCNTIPKLSYEAEVLASIQRRMFDIFIFVRHLRDYSVAWVLGFIEKDEFFNRARFVEKGTAAHRNYIYSSDKFILPIGQLNDPHDMKDFFQPRSNMDVGGQTLLNHLRDLFGAEVVTEEELEKDRIQFYSKKWDPEWLYKKKYPKRVIRSEPKVEITTVYRLGPKDIKFLLYLNNLRRDFDGQNHMRQLRAEALYALKIGERVSRSEIKTVFSDGTVFDLEGAPINTLGCQP